MQTKHYPLAVLLAIVAIVSSLYLNSLIAPAAPVAAKDLVADISTDRYMSHLSYLASDAMKGRGNGTPELEKAADYIASQFRAWGLKPAGDNGTFFQSVEVITGTTLGPNNQLTIDGTAEKVDADFVTVPFSNSAELAPEPQWDDGAKA